MGIRLEVTAESLFGQFADDLDAKLTEGETLAAHRLMALSTAVAPLDVGTLIGTAAVEPAQTPEEGAAVTYDTPYAARLHEHPEYNFQNGRQGKYLESPAVENKDELGQIILRAVQIE
ncbi:hypothetical protein [Microbacterium sp. KR10-403]|uniref:hypothetical protein n=1 Tax=Microbacterium sp. KR10-403 TaxID=3158581 RepID=UPI0032E394BE